VTAAENETSVVLWGDFGPTKALLTADAGVNALTWACDYAAGQGIDIQTARLVQVPTTAAEATLGRMCSTGYWGRRSRAPRTSDMASSPRQRR